MQQRVWVPEIGARVQLRTCAEYSSRLLPIWAWLRVDKVYTDLDVTLTVLNGDTPTDQNVHLPLACIDTPIGWKPQYTITVSPDKLDTVLSWFARGITVRQSHYMPTCPTSFQPMDNDASSDWRFNGADMDRVPAAQCDDVFSVSVLEQEYDVSVPAPVCDGTGIGRRYLSEIPKKERNKIVAAMHAEGWTVSYLRQGNACWLRERETVVKQFGQSAAAVLASRVAEVSK